MTLEQLSNLSDEELSRLFTSLPDSELNRLAAERVMGWRDLSANYGPSLWKTGEQEFREKDKWTPTTDRNQSRDLLAAMVGRGARFSIGFNLNEPFVARLEILPESTRWAEKNGPRARWNSLPGNSPRSETIAALLAAFAMEDKPNA